MKKNRSEVKKVILKWLRATLRKKRESLGMSQKYVAAILELNQATYSRYEQGEEIPKLITYIMLVDILQIDDENCLREWFKRLNP